MSSYHTKQFSRLLVPSAMVLSLVMPLEAHAGFQWITPLQETPLAAPTPVDKMPVTPKKDGPAAVQLPALEPVEPAPVAVSPVAVQPQPAPVIEPAPVAVPPVEVKPQPAPVIEPAPQPAPVVTPPVVEPPHAEAAPNGAPVVVTPTVVEHDAAMSQANQPVMDVVMPGAMPAATPVVSVAPVAEPVVTPVEPVVVADQPKQEMAVVAPVAPVPVKADTSTMLASLEPGAKIDGFGKNLPLVVVLKQLLPKDHVFAFEQGIDPGVRVSWKGGKGWRRVLADTLQPAGLAAHEENNLVSVIHAVAPEAVPQVAAVEPVAVPPVTIVEPVASVAAVAPVETVTAETVKPQEAPVALAAVEPVMPPVEPVAAAPVSVDAVPVTGKVVMPQATLEPPLLPGASDVWKASPGEHLRDVVKRWCDRAKVELVWSTEYDYPIQAGVSLTGSFEDAVRDLLSGFVDAKPQPFGRLHDNAAAGQRTLVVQTRGNTNGE